MEATDSEPNIDLYKYRQLIRSYIDLHLYSTALFWADKVVTISKEDPNDVYWQAQCMFHLRQYHRAALLIRNKGLDKTHNVCRYLAAKCLLEAKEYHEALSVLLGEDCENHNLSNTSLIKFDDDQADCEGFTSTSLQSAMLYLAGKIYEALDNRTLASECYKRALSSDVHSSEAFQSLIQHQMLTSKEEKDLMTSLFGSDDQEMTAVDSVVKCEKRDNQENEFVRTIYGCLTNKYVKVPPESSLRLYTCLEGNLDLEVAKAERHYYACAYSECFAITDAVLKIDPYHMPCLPIRIACLMELHRTNELYYLAHDLVDHYPEMAVSWFAVGCYYSLKGKSDPARRFLGKATMLDKLFGPGWLAYGHSFAVENEHDQAMAAYFKASQLLKGCHLPLLYIGLECGLTNNIKLAEKFFLQAQSIAPNDPFVIHEMGVVAFRNGEFERAESLFEEALHHMRETGAPVLAHQWEPLFNNLGHVARKLKKYEKALEYHQEALALCPREGSTLACIGLVLALMGNSVQALDYLHKALGLKRDDTFSASLLSSLMESSFHEDPLFRDNSSATHATPVQSKPILKTPSPPDLIALDAAPTFHDENS